MFHYLDKEHELKRTRCSVSVSEIPDNITYTCPGTRTKPSLTPNTTLPPEARLSGSHSSENGFALIRKEFLCYVEQYTRRGKIRQQNKHICLAFTGRPHELMGTQRHLKVEAMSYLLSQLSQPAGLAEAKEASRARQGGRRPRGAQKAVATRETHSKREQCASLRLIAQT